MVRTAAAGTRVLYNGHEIPAIFTNGYAGREYDSGVELTDRAPQLVMSTEDAARHGISDGGVMIQVVGRCGSSTTYLTRPFRPDRAGFATILLDAMA